MARTEMIRSIQIAAEYLIQLIEEEHGLKNGKTALYWHLAHVISGHIEHKEALSHRRVDGLFEALAHGDDEHRAWLKQAIADYFAGQPVAQATGKGSKEIIADLQAKLAQYEEGDRGISLLGP